MTRVVVALAATIAAFATYEHDPTAGVVAGQGALALVAFALKRSWK